MQLNRNAQVRSQVLGKAGPEEPVERTRKYVSRHQRVPCRIVPGSGLVRFCLRRHVGELRMGRLWLDRQRTRVRVMRARSAWMLVALVAGCARGTPPPQTTVDFALPDLAGVETKVEDLQGRVVLVDIWATWCKPCAYSFPFYADLQRRYGEDGLSVVAVSIDTHDDEVRDFLRDHPVPFVVLRDPDASLPEAMGLRTMPTAILLGRDGRGRFIHEGFVDRDKEIIEAKVREALMRP